TSHLTAEIKDRVKFSAILFIVMSKHYLRSHWCGDEINWFREQIEDRRIHEPGRVFIIRAQPTDESKWPEFLRDERGFAPLGFWFHDRGEDNPYDWFGSRLKHDKYVQGLITLRTTLIDHLRKLQSSRHMQIAQSAPRYSNNGTRRIYLHARAEDAPICEE